MIAREPVLAVIPARGGSKTLPRKHVRDVAGRPLIAWTIAAAAASRFIDRVVLSSDDAEIIEVARGLGCEVPFVRDAALAGDHALTIDVVLDALARLPGYPWVVLLQPTSPLRTADDIDGALALCAERGATSCVSVSAAAQSPYWMYRVGAAGRLEPLFERPAIGRRQDLPAVYHLNGAVYVARSEQLARTRTFVDGDTIAYEMPAARSCDIDTEDDLNIAAARLRS